MLITIYDRVGNFKAEVSPSDSSTQVKEIQGDNILTPLSHITSISLLMSMTTATSRGSVTGCARHTARYRNLPLEWVYDIKLYGIDSLLRNLLVLKQIDNEEDPVFTLTAPPREHVANDSALYE